MTPAEPDRRSLGGLSEAEVTARLGRDGHNDLPTARRRGFNTIAADLLREPMFVLLVACGVIYVVLGDPQEAFMLLGFVFLITGLTLYQEHKTERSLDRLRDLAARARSSSVTVGSGASPAGRWSATISSCSRRETASRPTPSFPRPPTGPSTNPC